MSSNDTVPDYVEPLDAFRFWRLNCDGFLTSVRMHDTELWLPGKKMESKQEVPRQNNKIGFHAYKWNDYLMSGIQSTMGQGWNVCVVFGSVKLWGRIIEHEHGYRSEYAMVEELYGILVSAPKRIRNSSFGVRKRGTFDDIVELILSNGYQFRPIDSPQYTKEVRPGLYKWTGEQPKKQWYHNPVIGTIFT